MQYMLICQDKPNSAELRQSIRPAHLDYIGQHDVRFAGPMLDADEQTMIGSVIVIEAPDRAAADQFAAADPYAQAGLFETVTIHPFKQVVPQVS